MKVFIWKKLLLFVLIVSLGTPTLTAQSNKKIKHTETTRILIIMDASKSMTGNWQGEEKYFIARQLLSDVLDSLKGVPNVDFALRVYGHQKPYPPQDCNDTKLEVPFSKDRPIERIKYRLKHIQPMGTSPIASSLSKAATDFTPCTHCRNIVILITDGKEECGGDICKVSARLQKKGIILKPFIIGIGNSFRESFNCAGTYFNAGDKQQFSDALNLIVTRVLSKTSLQVNLLNQDNKPVETNINLQFIDKTSGKVRYNFVHTLNVKGIPDTLIINPLPHYKLIVNTLPPTVVNDVYLTEGKHNIVSAKCPQGILKVNYKGTMPSDFNPAVLIRNINNGNLINVQYLNNSIKYLAGKYNIDILTLPPIHLNNFEIVADHKNNIEIEAPGIFVAQKNIRVFGAIFKLTKQGQQFIIRLNKNNTQQESFFLQPGKYRIVYRSRFQNQSIFTISKDFTIYSNKTTRIRF